MAECDRHPGYKDTKSSGSLDSIEEKIIQDELIWGLSYRHMKQKEKQLTIPSKTSPMDIPFKICREKERQRYEKKKASKNKSKSEEDEPKEEKSKEGKSKQGTPREGKLREGKSKEGKSKEGKSKQGTPREGKLREGKSKERKSKEGKSKQGTPREGKLREGKSKEEKSKEGKLNEGKSQEGKRKDGKSEEGKPKEEKPKEGKPKVVKPDKLSLLERSVLTQNQYMEYLAVPNIRQAKEEKGKKGKCRCYIEPCPPRVVQLALPKKRRVFANWKDYYNFLPTVMVMRFEKILHTDKNLEPREARYYYKKLDQQRRKAMRILRRLRKKKKAEKIKGDQAWIEEEIGKTVKVIMDYFMDEPLFTLNYRQLLISDGILQRLDESSILKKPSRGSKNQFHRSIIEFSDKLAIWMDILTKFVDIQAIDGDEDIAPLTVSSISEEEGSEDYSDLEKELWDKYGQGEGEGEFGSGFPYAGFMAGLLEGEDEGEGFGLLGDMDLDLLEKLIRILSNCSDEYLQTEVDPNRLPGVTYLDILNRVKELRDGILKKGPQKPFLELMMLEWAIKNEPDEIDEKMRKKIHETAALLGDFMFGAGGFRGYGAGAGADMYGEGMYGEEGEVDDEFMRGKARGLVAEAPNPFRLLLEGEEGGLSEAEYRRLEEEERRRLEEEERRKRAEMMRLAALEAEGADSTMTTLGLSTRGDEGEGSTFGDMFGEGFGEEGGEVDVLFGPGMEGKIIKGHKPSVILEHRPDMVCCLSLKIWAVWLLEITHNAHNWTKWVHCIILQIKEFASIIRGEVKLPNGETKVLYKAEWRKFTAETAAKLEQWREYSKHVKELSENIIANYHGKKVLNCCPKCLQDHLITNVVKAHETLAALTEAMNNAEYWQKCLDEIVQKTCRLTDLEQIDKEAVEKGSSEEEIRSSEESDEEVSDGELIYEIEELDPRSFMDQGRGRGACTPRQPGPSGSGPGGPGQFQCPPGPCQGPPGQFQGPPGQFQGPPGQFQGPPGPWQRGPGGPRPGCPPGPSQGGAGPSQGSGGGCSKRS